MRKLDILFGIVVCIFTTSCTDRKNDCEFTNFDLRDFSCEYISQNQIDSAIAYNFYIDTLGSSRSIGSNKYYYDSLGRITKEYSKNALGNSVKEYRYEGNFLRLIKIVDDAPVTYYVKDTVDLCNRRVIEYLYTSKNDKDYRLQYKNVYIYDKDNKLISKWLINAIDTDTIKFEYQYSNGKVYNEVSGDRRVIYEYNNVNRLQTIKYLKDNKIDRLDYVNERGLVDSTYKYSSGILKSIYKYW